MTILVPTLQGLQTFYGASLYPIL